MMNILAALSMFASVGAAAPADKLITDRVEMANQLEIAEMAARYCVRTEPDMRAAAVCHTKQRVAYNFMERVVVAMEAAGKPGMNIMYRCVEENFQRAGEANFVAIAACVQREAYL